MAHANGASPLFDHQACGNKSFSFTDYNIMQRTNAKVNRPLPSKTLLSAPYQQTVKNCFICVISTQI